MSSSKSRITKKYSIKTKRTNTGLGLFVEEPISQGEYIIEYKGPRLSNEARQRKGGKYLFEINSRETIDGSHRSNLARYANHACQPNCDIEIKNKRVYITARLNIQPGEELTYNYGKEYTDAYIKPSGCKCQSCVKKTKS
jgi:uncharacterized protein